MLIHLVRRARRPSFLKTPLHDHSRSNQLVLYVHPNKMMFMADELSIRMNAAMTQNSFKVLLAGPSGSGKTSLILRARFGKFVDVAPPTMGIQVEAVKSPKNPYSFCFVDIGEEIMSLGADAIVYMISAKDWKRNYKHTCSAQLWGLMQQTRALILVLINFVDIVKLDCNDVFLNLGLHRAHRHFVGCKCVSVKTGENFRESMFWVINSILGYRHMMKYNTLEIPSSKTLKKVTLMLNSKSPKPILDKKQQKLLNASFLELPASTACLDEPRGAFPKFQRASKWAVQYANAGLSSIVFKQKLNLGTLPHFEVFDVARGIFSFICAHLSGPHYFVDPHDCILSEIHENVSILFRLPKSLLKNSTATCCLIDIIAYSVQRFSITKRRFPAESEFGEILFTNNMANLGYLLWLYYSPELLLTNAAQVMRLVPDLLDLPYVWILLTDVRSRSQIFEYSEDYFCVLTEQKQSHLDFVKICYEYLCDCEEFNVSNVHHLEQVFGNINCTQIMLIVQIIWSIMNKNKEMRNNVLSFANFVLFFPQVTQLTYWRKYYSVNAWKKARVSSEFIVPDKQKVDCDFLVPSVEKLRLQFSKSFSESCDLDRLSPLAPSDITHCEFLFVIFDSFYPILKTSSIRCAQRLCALYSGKSTAQVPRGLTHLYFWICIIANVLCFVHVTGESVYAFDELLEKVPALLWPDLWSLYYTIERIWSDEGMSECLEPDIQRIPPLHTINNSV